MAVTVKNTPTLVGTPDQPQEAAADPAAVSLPDGHVRIRVLTPFYLRGEVQAVGCEIAVPRRFGIEMAAANRAAVLVA